MGTEVDYSHLTPDGQPKVKILIVGEFPNIQEHDRQVIIGTKGGTELRFALKAAGFDSDIAYTYLVRCRPIDRQAETREPTPSEQLGCAQHVWEDIDRLQPDVVVTMGILATRALVPYKRWHDHNIHEISGETYRHKGTLFFPIPTPYMWAFQDNPYVDRQRLKQLLTLLHRVVDGDNSEFTKLGNHWYCDTIAKVKIAIKQVCKLDATINPVSDLLVGLDTEGQNTNRVATNGVSCVQLAPRLDTAYLIPIDHHDSPWTPEERTQVLALLRSMFLDPNLKFVAWAAHMSKHDMGVLYKLLNIKRFAKPTVDPMFLEYLNDENLRANDDSDEDGGRKGSQISISLKALSLTRCNFRHYDSEILEYRTQHEGFWRLPMHQSKYDGSYKVLAKKYTDYSCMDSYVGSRLAIEQKKEMDQRGYTRAFDLAIKLGYRFSHLFTKMEQNGICIDRSMLDFLDGPHSPIGARIVEIPKEIQATDECIAANERVLSTDRRTAGMQSLFGHKPWVFDLRKKEHLVALFVDSCGLKPIDKRLEPGKLPSIDRHFYAAHDWHPTVQLMQEYTGLFKLQSSYVNALRRYLTSDKYPDNLADGRLHPSFDATGTVTGRVASSKPSVHQIPRSDTFAKKCIKSLIGCDVGNIVMEADYAQAEVRWWAQLSGDKDFADMFWRMLEIQETYYKNPTAENRVRKELECDVHRQVAALMFGLSIDQVDSFKRQSAKSLTFGCIYGQTSQALATILKCSVAEAEELQQKFIGRFKQAGPWLLQIEEIAKRQGYVETCNGRRRHLRNLFLHDESSARRMARNSPIQAIASDFMGEAAYEQQVWIEDRNYDVDNSVRVINLVHDALIQEIRLDYDLIAEVIQSTRYNMMHKVNEIAERDYGFKMIVPMVADFKLGLRWGHAYEWDQGEDLQELVSKLQKQNQRLENGEPFWHIAVEEGIKSATKDVAKKEEAVSKSSSKEEKSKATAKLHQAKSHMSYLQNIPKVA